MKLIFKISSEELQAEEKKILEQFKKDQESAIKKAKVVENTLKQVQVELENFQVNTLNHSSSRIRETKIYKKSLLY